MSKQKFTAEEVADALRKSRGLLGPTADKLGCSYQTVQNYIDRYPTVAEAKTDSRERLVDKAEFKLMLAIEKGEAWAIAMVLKTLGKHRGYVERTEQEISGVGGKPIAIGLIEVIRGEKKDGK